ncbi:dipeptidase [Nitrospirillum sp. BR 11163]|uniref:dipeptidase n=1 Tax=Nitrospirillum sp. BR 11163 TaxID=3104323 RepID=UPI002AFF9592|nr:membrane dipeptidase [Nitrospirillum sp. BR 11163]MEA1672725.1 membrane dipeptidase [Nitrospirillum sp. BR 11163]
MPATDNATARWGLSPAAAALHADALVWDNTVPWSGFGRAELKAQALAHHIGAGADFVSVTVATDGHSVAQTIEILGQERAYFLSDPSRFRLCETVDDILAAKAAGLLGVNFHFQGTNAFARDVGLVEIYYKLGVRHALMAYNQKNHVGDGCHERTDGGLSRFGVALIQEMNRVGMMVDCSHTGYRTAMETLEHSTAPVIFSHSNAKALHDHPRNITDDQIDACARTGGVIGVNGIGVFLGGNDASTERYLQHVDYLVQRVGPAHVAIGLDWVYDMDSLMAEVRKSAATYPDGAYNLVINVAQPEQLPEITDGLLRRGYSEDDVRAILGLNWVRVARSVWK